MLVGPILIILLDRKPKTGYFVSFIIMGTTQLMTLWFAYEGDIDYSIFGDPND